MNRELIAIANEAIPLDPKCAINTKRAIVKRLWLVEKIEEYCRKQIMEDALQRATNEFNSKHENIQLQRIV